MPGGANTSPAQPCPPFTCTHPFKPPTPARTLSTKSPNLSTLALFWILNSLCTSQLWKPYAVLPRVRLSLTRSVVTRTPLNLSSHKTSVCGNQCITSLSPEPVLHSQRHRHQKMLTSLNLSLARVLHVYDDHTGLLAGTGFPPLQLTRYVHLAQLHFRLTITRPDTLPALLFKKLNSSLPLPNLHTSTLDYHIRYATHAFKIDLQTDPLPY